MATTAIGLARYAREYFDAAKAADDVIGNRSGYELVAPPPVMFLTTHAIELAFKAYLLHSGKTISELKEIGHNLWVLWTNCSNNKINEILNLDVIDLELLKLISELHLSNELRYIATGYKTFPVFGPLQKLASKILNSICPFVGYKRSV